MPKPRGRTARSRKPGRRRVWRAQAGRNRETLGMRMRRSTAARRRGYHRVMSHDHSEFLRYWENVRGRPRRLVPLVPAERLEWAPGPGRFTCGDLVRHLAAIERWMFA